MNPSVRETGLPRGGPADALALLNDEQRRAAHYGVARGARAGPLLIIAGAGTGKTSTLAHRVAHLILNGADPRRLLLMTFSRRAALELERRAARVVERVLGLPAERRALSLAWCGTFHGIGARLLRDYASRIGLATAFTILDRADSVELMGMVRHERGHSESRRRFPEKSTCLAIYSRTVNAREDLATVLETAYPWCAQWHEQLAALFGGYVREKQAQNVLDYDDLLLYWEQMAGEPTLAAEMAARFDHVLVDEYQDTNRLQSRILAALWPSGAGLTVVGDDAQSIYSFRAATVQNILEFAQQFTPPAECITLERNYRSTQPILAACNAVIGEAGFGYRKTLWSERESSARPLLVTVRDEADEASYVADSVLARRETGMRLREQAVLFRSAGHSTLLELELARRNIPFVKYGGLKFLEAAHIKDVLSLLRWADNPRHRLAALRAVQILPQVGPATAARLLAALPGVDDAAAALERVVPIPAARHDWHLLTDCVRELARAPRPWPGDLERVLQWYAPHLERRHADATVRRLDLEQLLQIAVLYGTRQRFLAEMTLDPPEAVSDEAGVPLKDDDYLVLSTIHSAKGQEWKAVSVLRVVDGCIPSDMATGSEPEIEEERRLLYVAMTRARDELELLVPQRFYVHHQSHLGDKHVYALRSRFIAEALRSHFDERVWPAPPAEHDGGAPDAGTGRVDLPARVRAQWRDAEGR